MTETAQRFRFHVVGLPHTRICNVQDYSCCAFSLAIRGFIRMMMSLGHEVIFYGSDDSDITCTERVVINTKTQREAWFGADDGRQGFFRTKFDRNQTEWAALNRRAIGAIDLRIQPHDFICIQGGHAQSPIGEAFPNHHTVEYLIGYDGTFAKFRDPDGNTFVLSSS